MFLLGRNELYRLEETSPHEETVITTLLRTYGGLFTDYVYIDEALIAQQANLTKQQVYLNLKALSQRRILHFIPRRKMPYITYTQDREETNRIIIPPSVYEERKEQFIRRIKSMQHYATNDDICRSRQLLRYFGELQTKDCAQCDVCLEHQTDQLADKRLAPVRQQLIALLSDNLPHPITELKSLAIPQRQLDAALQYLISEERILSENGILRLY